MLKINQLHNLVKKVELLNNGFDVETMKRK